MNSTTKVEGSNDERDVKVFTISTCGWCKKVKKMLKEMDVEYHYVDIDQLEGEESKRIKEELEDYNPKKSCPTMVIDDGEHVIIGYKEEEIKEVLGDEE